MTPVPRVPAPALGPPIMPAPPLLIAPAPPVLLICASTGVAAAKIAAASAMVAMWL
jgi:hypothetical protein